MRNYAVSRYNEYGEFDISTLFWGALIVVALVVACLLASKAIDWLRSRKKFDGVVTSDPEEPWDQAISRPSADYFGDGGLGALGGLGGMNKREQEEIFSIYAPREVRKAMKERRRAREEAQRQSKRSN